MIDFRNSDPGDSLPFDAIRAAIGPGPFTSLDEVQALLDQHVSKYNDTPQDELGGLSPHQAQDLFEGDWMTYGPLRLGTDLAFGEVRHADFLMNARHFLNAGLAENGIPATAAKNLNRKFVTAMLEQMRWPEGFVADVRKWKRVINEDDVFPLHVLRVVLKVARCIRLTKGKFRTTGAAKRLLKESNAGDLYVRLFRTFFREFNLAYLDRMAENPGMQHTIAYSLYRLGLLATDWCSADALTDRILLDTVREPSSYLYREDEIQWQTRSRIVRPLLWFGLIESRDLARTDSWLDDIEIRKSPLYDRFLKFDL